MPFAGFAPPQGFLARRVSAGAFPLLAPDGTAAAPSYSFASGPTYGAYLSGTQYALATAGVVRLILDANALYLVPSLSLGTGGDCLLIREAAATLQMGLDVNGAPVHQAFKAHDGITGTDIAGANLTIAGGRGTGSGAPGQVILSVATELATGTTAQTLAAILTLSGGNNASVTSHFVYTAPTADLAMTASTESIGLSLGGSATYTREYATGALALHRENYVQAPTIAFVGASTLTDAATFAVSGPPIAGANATLTRTWIAMFGTFTAPVISFVNGVYIGGVTNAGITVRETSGGAEAMMYCNTTQAIFGSSSGVPCLLQTSNATRLTIAADGTTWTIASATSITFPDACNFVFNATTGTKFGTATTQKQSWWNATPVVQGALIADASGGATVDAEARTAINTLLARVRLYGLIATV